MQLDEIEPFSGSNTDRLIRGRKQETSFNNRKLRELGGKCVSASKIEGTKEGIISESEPKVLKVQFRDSEFHCHSKSDGKAVHVDVDNEFTEDNGKSCGFRFATEKINENETSFKCDIGTQKINSKGLISVQRSNRKLIPVKRWGISPYF